MEDIHLRLVVGRALDAGLPVKVLERRALETTWDGTLHHLGSCAHAGDHQVKRRVLLGSSDEVVCGPCVRTWARKSVLGLVLRTNALHDALEAFDNTSLRANALGQAYRALANVSRYPDHNEELLRAAGVALSKHRGRSLRRGNIYVGTELVVNKYSSTKALEDQFGEVSATQLGEITRDWKRYKTVGSARAQRRLCDQHPDFVVELLERDLARWLRLTEESYVCWYGVTHLGEDFDALMETYQIGIVPNRGRTRIGAQVYCVPEVVEHWLKLKGLKVTNLGRRPDSDTDEVLEAFGILAGEMEGSIKSIFESARALA